MRTILLTSLLCWCWAASALGQGTVNFTTKITGVVDAPVFDVDGTTPLAGSAYLARLYAGKTADSLVPVGLALPFRTGAGAGYVDTASGATREIPGIAAGATAYVQVRAWEAAKGATYETAQAAGGKTGASATFSVATGGGLNPPTPLVGLKRFNLTRSAPPTITTQPAPVTTGLGGSARFTVVASGPGPLAYQWRKGASTLSGATSATLEINSVVAGDAGTYTVRVSNTYGYVDSTGVTLTIAPLPTITGVTVSPNPPVVGKALHLGVTVGAGGPVTYQWQLNGKDLPGATAATLDRAAAEAGTFSVQVTGPGGTAKRDVTTVSAQWILTIADDNGGTVTVTPSQATYPSGTKVTLTAKSNAGYAFAGWSGDLTSAENPATLTMDGHKSVTPLFRPTGGTVNFVNRITGTLDAPVYETDGVTKLSSAYWAQLWAGPSPDLLEAASPPIAFRDGIAAGYFVGEERSIPGVSAGDLAYVQVRAWRASDGATYAAAAAKAGGHFGESPLFTVITGNAGSPPSLPAVLLGLQTFKLHTAADASWTLTLAATTGGTVKATPTQATYKTGTTVTLTPTAEPGWEFAGWTGDLSGAANPGVVTMNANRSVTAQFRPLGGTVDFVNRITGTLDAPVFDVDGTTRLAGAAFVAQLYAGPSAGSLAAVGAPEEFRTGAAAGYFLGEQRSIPTVGAGATAYVQVRAWRVADGATYEAALTAKGHVGESSVFTVTTGNAGSPPTLPAVLLGLKSFRLHTAADASWTLALATATGGTVNATPSQATYKSGTVVTLTAKAETGWEFASWTGDLVSTVNPATVTMDGNKSVTAQFRPIGGTVSFVNRITGSLDAPVFDVDGTSKLSGPNYVAQLYAGPTADALAPVGPPEEFRTGAGIGYFLGEQRSIPTVRAGDLAYLQVRAWRITDGATYEAAAAAKANVGESLVFTVITGNAGSPPTLPATLLGLQSFKLHTAAATQWTLALATTTGGAVSANPAQATYVSGTVVTVTAKAEPGWEFGGWTGGLTGTANPASVTMNANKAVTAQFRPTGGTVNFANRITGTLDAPVFDTDGVTKLAGSAFVAQLYAGPTPESLAPIGPSEEFRTGAGAGYFLGEQRSILSVAPGGIAQIQVRAWRVSDGATYEAASAAGGHVGSSPLFSVVTGNQGSPPSLPAILAGLRSFSLQLGGTPTIVRQPSAILVLRGATAKFEVVAAGPEPLAYQWRKGTASIAGATRATFQIDAVTAADVGSYSVRVSNDHGYVDSTAADLTILEPPSIVRLVVGPSATPTAGSALHLEVVAAGSGPLLYQWLLNGTEIGGATAAVLDRAAAIAGTYRIRITGPGGSLERDVVTVTTEFALTLTATHGGTITATPAQATYPSGSSVSIRAEAESGYEFAGWSQDLQGTANPATLVMNAPKQVSGLFRATGGTITFANRITGVIDAAVFDSDGTTKLAGTAFRVQLYAGPTLATLAPVGAALPFRSDAGAGYFLAEERSIASVAPGQVAKAQLRAWQASAGATFEAAAANHGKIGVSTVLDVVTGNRGSPPSLPGLLVGLESFSLRQGSAPVVSTPPAALVAIPGKPARLSVVASGFPAPEFAWRKNDRDLPGATAASLEFLAVTAADAGLYSVRISNAVGVVETTPVALSVLELPAITRVTAPASVVAGDPAKLEVVATGSAPLHYQWYEGSASDLSHPVGADAATLTTPALLRPATYWVRVTNPAGGAESATVSIDVSRRPQTITFADLAPIRFGGGPITLAATASSGLPVVFSLVSGPGTVVDGIARATGVGVLRIRAAQPGNDRYLPAPTVDRELVVEKAPATLTFGSLERTFDGTPQVVAVTAQPPELVVRVTYQGSPTAPTAAGEYLVEATVDDPNYSGLIRGTLVIKDGVGISGSVYVDLDGDGNRGTEEAGLPSVRLHLLALDATTAIRTETTDTTGGYAFKGVPSGSFYLHVETPSGYASTTPNLRLITVHSGETTEVSFGVQAVGTIAGAVFEDVDGDGTRDDDEKGLAGVMVRLLSNDAARTTTTVTDGSYQFPGMAAGTYTVEEIEPAGYSSTTPNQRTVNLASGGSATASFGEQAAATVSGIVFDDRNGNGLEDSDEPGLPGVSVRLSGPAGARTTTTSDNGSFRFAGVVPGTYVLEEFDPSGFTSTSPNRRTVVLASGGSATAVFGDQAVGSVVGDVFVDGNGNGLRDAGEVGLGGVSISLTGAAGTVSTITANDGTYEFIGVTAGNYTVAETDPAGFVSTTPNLKAVVVAAGGSAAASFGDQPVQTIAGVVFEDLNGNGEPDPGEPGIAGVALRLLRASDSTSIAETLTTSDGRYAFVNVPAGAYLVRQAIPSSYTVLASSTPPPAPSLHGNPGPTEFAVKAVSLADGGSANASFGINVVARLSGVVFDDLDGDGLPSAAEPGLGGITIEVRHLLTDGLVATTVTTGDGVYVVSSLPAGQYAVTQKPVAGYSTPKPVASVTVASGGAAVANFANRVVASISGRVYSDENGDGTRDLAEPGMGGVIVTLTRAGASARQAVTAGDGSFVFSDVAPGDIRVEQAPPAGFHATTSTFEAIHLVAGAAAGVTFGNQSDSVRPPTLTREPDDLLTVAGAGGTLEVQATGTAPLRYEWLKDGKPVDHGTNATLTLTRVSAADAGSYQVRVRNPLGAVLSRTVQVTVSTQDGFTSWIAAQSLPVEARDPQDDPDADGLSNLLEWVLGTAPGQATTSGAPKPVDLQRDDQTYVGFELARQHAAASVRLYLEGSDDLVQWTEIPTAIDVATTGATADVLYVSDRSPISEHGFRFLRLRAAPGSVTAAAAKLTILSGAPLTTTFRLALEGTPGVTYAVERSDDLKQWTLVQTVTASATAVTIVDGSASGVPARFYRAVAQ